MYIYIARVVHLYIRSRIGTGCEWASRALAPAGADYTLRRRVALCACETTDGVTEIAGSRGGG